jgi:hypothetical protein
MEGIGTFCHEFSHVLGLPDLYNTYSSNDSNTPGRWDIMDAGCYNGLTYGDGDVPAMYSAYEMFYVGWLTPEILTGCDYHSLEPLENSPKKAYLVASSNSHNLDGKNPNAAEFYMLENRQKVSYDKYLPNSGLLVTRIKYNASSWDNNTVNNSSSISGKGVYIIPAGSSSSNWVFPVSNKTEYSFASASGTNWSKKVSQITRNTDTKTVNFNFQQTNCPTLTSSNENINNIRQRRPAAVFISCATTAVQTPKENSFEVIYQQNAWKINFSNSNYNAELYNINGTLLKSENFYSEISISNETLPKGVYILKINDLSNRKTHFSKVVKF